MRPLTLAVVQTRPEIGNAEKNLAHLLEFVDMACAERTDVICFPEACLTGYSTQYADRHAIAVNDPAVLELIKLAKCRNITIVFGLMERTDKGMFVTQIAAAPENTMLYRKTHLGHVETDIFVPGNELPVIRTAKACIGIQLCWESHIPDIATAMRTKGMELLLIPHSCGLGGRRRIESWDRFLAARADDNGIFVAACNAITGTERTFGGGTVAYGPKGNKLAEYCGDDEHMTVVELDGNLPRNSSDDNMSSISYFDRRRPELYI
jgi:predicted amidohydrolase